MFKIEALKAIYRFYDKFLEGFPLVCQKGCCTCCTTNVSVTSLEVDYLLPHLTEDLLKRVDKEAQTQHFIPNTTINTSATLCLSGKEPPAETSFMSYKPCPLLSNDGLCTIYEKRPFACRAMSSETPCPEGGEAYMAPFLVTVNLAIYQIIEHIDSEGFYGNLLDLISLCKTKGEERLLKINSLTGKIKTNRPIPCFIIPPDETMRFKSFMRRLSKEKVNKEHVLGDLLPKNWQIIN